MQIKRKSFHLSVLFAISIVLSSLKTSCMQENNYPKKIFVHDLQKKNKIELSTLPIFELIFLLLLPVGINLHLMQKDIPPNAIASTLRLYATFSLGYLFIAYTIIKGEIAELKAFMADKKIRVRNRLKSNLQSKKDYIINLECSICLGNNGPLYSNSNINCPHLYHSSCLSQWLNTSNNIDKQGMLKCVICKRSLNCLLIKDDESKKDV